MKQTSIKFFTDEQRSRISSAVEKAESATSGEIVPVLASTSDRYERALFLAAIAFGVVATLAMLALFCFPFWPQIIWSVDNFPLPWPLILFAVVQLVAMIVGYGGALRNPGIHRAFIPHAVMQRRVDLAAHRAFHQFRLTHTDAATGIMIYVSLFEHMVVVLADKAISQKHKHEDWDRVRDLLVAGIKSGDAESGFVNAIAACGEILTTDFPIQPDDANELPNELRLI